VNKKTKTDLDALHECTLGAIRVTGLTRLKANETPPDIDCFSVVRGQQLKVIIAVKSRLPVKELVVTAESEFCESITARPIGSVKFPEAATYLPDPVLESTGTDVPANSTESYLLTMPIERQVAVGNHQVVLKFTSTTHKPAEKRFTINVLSLAFNESQELGNNIFWPHWDTLCHYYDIELWSETFWKMAELYLAEMKCGGMNSVMVSIVDDSFRYPLPECYYYLNDYPSMIKWRRNNDGTFSFDYIIYDRYVELNFKHGIDHEIECHAMLPCKCQKPLISYYDERLERQVSHETTYDSPDYIFAMESFLKDFLHHNRERKWADKITICPYDEPQDIESFKAVAELVKRCAPEFKISAAMSREIALEIEDTVDIATVSSVSLTPASCQELITQDFEARWYNCCNPAWGNFLFCCPLIDSYRTSWMTFANGLSGFLRWSIIDWTDNVWDNPAFNWPTGDMHLLYPGKHGPVSSLRWEAYKTGNDDLKIFLAAFATADKPLKHRLKQHLSELGVMTPLAESGWDIHSWREKLFAIAAFN
jgi:hypothetical protein